MDGADGEDGGGGSDDDPSGKSRTVLHNHGDREVGCWLADGWLRLVEVSEFVLMRTRVRALKNVLLSE